MTGAIAPITVEAVVQRSVAETSLPINQNVTVNLQTQPRAEDVRDFAMHRAGAFNETQHSPAVIAPNATIRTESSSSNSSASSLTRAVDWLDELGQRFSSMDAKRHEAQKKTGDWGSDMIKMMDFSWDMSMSANMAQTTLAAVQAGQNCVHSVLTLDKS